MAPRFAAITFAALLSAAATPSGADLRLGFANPLSGPYTASGHRNRVAVELAVRDLNLDGGVLGDQVELVVVDDGCGVERAADAARTLIGAGVTAVIGHMCSHSSLMAAGHYEAADVLMITPSSTHPRLTEEGRRNVFRLIGRDDRQGEVAGSFLAKRHGDARIAILHDGTTYGTGLAQRTRLGLAQHGGAEELFLRYEPNADSHGDLVTTLAEAAIEVVYIGGYGPDAAAILKAARERGADFQLIGGDGLGMDEFWSIAGEDGEGTVFSRPAIFAPPPKAAPVLRRFEARGLGERTGGLGVYAAVQVWAAAVNRAGTNAVGQVARLLRRGRFETVLGPVSFNRKGDLEGAGWSWQVWRDGAFEALSVPATQ